MTAVSTNRKEIATSTVCLAHTPQPQHFVSRGVLLISFKAEWQEVTTES